MPIMLPGDVAEGYVTTDTAWVGLTPHGRPYAMSVRPGTSDWNTANACAGTNDEYHIPEGMSGWALDIGAHIGAATVPLLIDNPELRVIAVEALPENVALLRQNIARNQLGDRAVVVHAAAGDGQEVRIGYGPHEGELSHSEFIGSAVEGRDRYAIVQGVSLAMLLGIAHGGPFSWVKMDCEQCEYPLLEGATRASLEALVHIEGEHHAGFERIAEVLRPTHDVKFIDGTEDFGHFRAVPRNLEREMRLSDAMQSYQR